MARQILIPKMRVSQTLASDVVIRQDFRTAVRFVFFDTGDEQWQYATHGGTMFVVLCQGKPFGLTCRHVLQGFEWNQIVVTDQKFGKRIAGLRSVAYPSRPKDDAIDTDLLDVAVIELSDDIDAAFFRQTAYVLDKGTIATSKVGDTLYVAGALKENSEITEDTIKPIYCLLEFTDETTLTKDPTLRQAIAKYENMEFTDVVGLSGSPLFNVTRNALCGMVVRGGINAGVCTLSYVDIFDIAKLLTVINEGRSETYYKKQVTRIMKTWK